VSRTLLIDADIVAYKFASTSEEVHYFDGADDAPAVKADLDHATSQARYYIEELQESLGADKIIVCLSDPDANFRKTLSPTYKLSRVGTRKPEDLMRVKEWMATAYMTYQRPALEADDCMGILSTHPTLVRGEKIIVSEDKDMQGIPGTLFNPAKDKEPRRIGKLSADRYHLWQTIVGDSCDGYPGAKGIGPKSPEAIGVLAAKTVEEAWGFVLQAYERSISRREDIPADQLPLVIAQDAVLQARLARILRATDWDFTRKAPRLWVPPSISH